MSDSDTFRQLVFSYSVQVEDSFCTALNSFGARLFAAVLQQSAVRHVDVLADRSAQRTAQKQARFFELLKRLHLLVTDVQSDCVVAFFQRFRILNIYDTNYIINISFIRYIFLKLALYAIGKASPENIYRLLLVSYTIQKIDWNSFSYNWWLRRGVSKPTSSVFICLQKKIFEFIFI